MPIYLVSSAGAGEQASVGEHEARNAAGSFTPAGMDGARLAVPSLNWGQDGAGLTFDFRAAAGTAGSSALLPLSGPPLLLASAGDQSGFGRPGLVNAAQAACPDGVAPGGFGAQLHAYRPGPAGALALDLADALTPGAAASLQLSLSGREQVLAAVAVGDTTALGTARAAHGAKPALPVGIAPDALALPVVHGGGNGAGLTLDFAAPAGTAGSSALLPLSGPPLLLASAGDQGGFGRPGLVNAAQAATPMGMAAPDVPGTAGVFADRAAGVILGLNLALSWDTPEARALQLAWGTRDKALALAGWDAFDGGLPGVVNAAWTLAPSGDDGAHVPAPALRVATHPVAVPGWRSGDVGQASVDNVARTVASAGFATLAVGTATVFNRWQFARPGGWSSPSLGKPALLGGLWTLSPRGFEGVVGQVTVVNTRATRTLLPWGIEAPKMPSPVVPMLWPSGWNSAQVGEPHVQHPPQPEGWLSSASGYPAIEYKTRVARPGGIESADSGYPVVRDRAQRVLHVASDLVAVFGDVRAWRRNQTITASGEDALEMDRWTDVHTLRRWLLARGFEASAWGETAMRNGTPSLLPDGPDAAQWGVPDAGYRVRALDTPGIASPFPPVGAPTLWQTPGIAPDGMSAPGVPAPEVDFRHRAAPVQGWLSQQWGDTRVEQACRAVRPTGFMHEGAGDARVEHEVRWLQPVWPGVPGLGTAWVSPWVRVLSPESIEAPYMHLPVVGDGMQRVGPEGFEATQWLSRIIPENQTVYPLPWDAAYGWPTVGLHTRQVWPGGFSTDVEPSLRWGTARAWNLTQVAQQFEDPQNDLWPPPWTGWTLVENRNRAVGVQGWAGTRWGYQQVDNAARAVLPTGIAAPVTPQWPPRGAVTHRVRALSVEGADTLVTTRWGVVWNAAAVLAPPGIGVGVDAGADAFGRAALVNTRRYYPVPGHDGAAVGEPLVADAVRTVAPQMLHSIEAPPPPAPDVGLYTRYLEPAGVGDPRWGSYYGVPELNIVWRIIGTRWTHQERAGEPGVRNATPELRAGGYPFDAWGNPAVRLGWRPLPAQGEEMTQWGQALVADRRQVAAPRGFNALTVSDKLTTHRFGAQPTPVQFIDLRKYTKSGTAEDDIGYGIFWGAPDTTVPMGRPDLLWRSIRLGDPGDPRDSQIDTLAMGHPVVTYNTLRVEPGMWGLLIGEPGVTGGVRTLEAEGIEAPSVNVSYGHGLWPHTVYVMHDPPPQAVANHPILPHPGYNAADEGGAMGHAVVWRNEQTPCVAKGHDTARVSTEAVVGNRLRIAAPSGIYAARFGWPTLPCDLTVLADEPPDTMELGAPGVAPPPEQVALAVRPKGLTPPAPPLPQVDLLHRALPLAGFDALEVSASRGAADQVPHMPSSLYVGPPLTNLIGGYDAAGYGDAWLSHRVREVSVQGLDALACEYDYQQFALRMRVRRVEEPPQWRVLRPVGDDSARVGTPGVMPLARFIRPDGNAEQYRKGAF